MADKSSDEQPRLGSTSGSEVADLADRIRKDSDDAIHPVVRIFDERGGFEVATGYKGVGVFVTVLSGHGKRRLVTHGLTEKEATRLGKAIVQAAEASIVNRQRRADR